MSQSTDKLCEICLKQPATSAGLWRWPGATLLCRDCLATSITYDQLIDSLQKRACLPEQVTQMAKALLQDMSERMGLSTALLKQELETLGVKLADTSQAEE